MKLDMAPDKSRIEHVGAEDRALLRSNPSPAADAGMGVWRWSSRWCWGLATPSPKRGCHPGRKAINLSRPPSSTPSGVPYGKIFGAVRYFCLLTHGSASLHRGLLSLPPPGAGRRIPHIYVAYPDRGDSADPSPLGRGSEAAR